MAERQREELRRVGADIALHGRQTARGSPTHGSLTILEDYAMDTGGYIILRSVISPDQAATLAGEPAAAVERQLAGNETVAECVEGLCGAGWRQDGPLALLPEVKASRGLGGRVGAVDNARAYTEPRGAGSWTRLCQGVKVFWALADCPQGAGGLVISPASHRALTQPPPGGLDPDGEMMTQPVLAAGDVLLAAAELVHGLRPWTAAHPQAIAAVEYIAASARPTTPPPAPPAPEWVQELGPAERAVLGYGDEGAQLVSDGDRCWFEGGQAAIHPGLHDRAEATADALAVDPDELYFWDVRGYLVVRGLMDKEWCEAANAAIEAVDTQLALPTEPEPRQLPRWSQLTASAAAAATSLGWDESSWAKGEATDACEREWSELSDEERAAADELGYAEGDWPFQPGPPWTTLGHDLRRIESPLAGSGRPGVPNLLTLPQPHAEPFRKMIAHPGLVARLQWMMGSGFHLGSQPNAITSVRGTSGHALHAGGTPMNATSVYRVVAGRTYCNYINVAYQLRDVTEADGGYMCVLGSHKAAYELPGVNADFSGQGFGVSADPTALAQSGHLQHVAMKAGDCVLFMGATQTHGAFPWESGEQRRTVLMGFYSPYMAHVPRL